MYHVSSLHPTVRPIPLYHVGQVGPSIGYMCVPLTHACTTFSVIPYSRNIGGIGSLVQSGRNNILTDLNLAARYGIQSLI